MERTKLGISEFLPSYPTFTYDVTVHFMYYSGISNSKTGATLGFLQEAKFHEQSTHCTTNEGEVLSFRLQFKITARSFYLK